MSLKYMVDNVVRSQPAKNLKTLDNETHMSFVKTSQFWILNMLYCAI